MKQFGIIRVVINYLPWAFLVSTVVSAPTNSFTATGWVNQVLAPPIICPTAAGPVLLRATAFTVRMEATDPRLTGRRTVFSNGYVQPDGSIVDYGTAYHEVGTWTGTNFTPSGGLWELTWRGTMQTNNSMQHTETGYGYGAAIDGLRLVESATGAEAPSPLDPAVPFLYTGTIQSSPASATLVQEDFNLDAAGWDINYRCGSCWMNVASQQLYTKADWGGCAPATMQNYFFARCRSGAWNLADGQTLECQADLIKISEDTTNMAMLWLGSDSGIYAFDLGNTGVGFHKWTPQTGNDVTFFWWENTVHNGRSNVTFHVTLTRDNDNLLIITRLLDRSHSNRVLFERTFMDTSKVDPTLTTAEFVVLSGMTNMDPVVPDPGAPLFQSYGFSGGVGAGQLTDGFQPPVEAVFDNFIVKLHDESPLKIAPAMELSWPVPAGVNYGVEAAPTLQGPWQRVQASDVPGVKRLTVPSIGPSQFFRLMREP